MAAEPFIVAKKFGFFKLEAARGTLETSYTGERNVRIYGIELDPQLDLHVREFASNYHSAKASAVPGMSMGVVKFKHDFALNQRVDLAPPCAKFLKACGLAEETVFQSIIDFPEHARAYLPKEAEDVGDTLSGVIVYVNAAGAAIAAVLKGMMGNCVIETEKAGHFPVCNFEFKGALVGIGDLTDFSITIPTEAFTAATVPPTYKGAVVDADDVHQYFGKFSFDFGNQVEMLESASEDTAIEAAYIAKREPKLSWNTLARLDSVDDSTLKWRTGEEFPVVIETSEVGVIEQDVYDAYDEPDFNSVLRLNIFKGQIMANKPSDMKGAFGWDREVVCHNAVNEYDSGHQNLAWALTILPTEIV